MGLGLGVWNKLPESGLRVAPSPPPPQMTLADQQTQQLGSLPYQILVNHKQFDAALTFIQLAIKYLFIS